MDEFEGVKGKMGDVSGKMGDVSGKMGDVSGAPRTLAEVHQLFLRDRQAETISSLRTKISRLESEILAIAQWLDGRIVLIEEQIRTENLRDRMAILESDVRLMQETKPPVT